ncbi:ATP-binding protein [Kitasatospora sp. NPDC091207]|uniref:ATP-binding protein n=1 Tax=Kitasatospora sp. NPDC091207 TaxID=3364083 RepID=UPI00380079FB
MPALVPETADAVVLAVPELVTNALRHGGGAFVLNPAANAERVEVAVHDRHPRPLRMRTPDLVAGTGGFGRPVVNRLAEHMGNACGRAVRNGPLPARLHGQTGRSRDLEPLTVAAVAAVSR